MKAARGGIAATFLAIALASTTATTQHAMAPASAPSSTTTSTSTATPQSSASIPPSTQKPVDGNTPEVSSQEDTSTTFKVKVNLVEVRVVVRDAYGKAVGNLRQEDFQLTDNGKPQVISKFSMEQSGAKRAPKPASSGTPIEDAAPKLPERYVVYLFDDIHLKFGDLAQVRAAAWRNLQTLQPTDRAAILTTSGQTQLDFTDDRGKLHGTLNRLLPHPITGSGVQECFDISYYLADQIVNKNDATAAGMVAAEAAACNLTMGGNELRVLAQRALDLGGHETHVSLATLQDVVRRLGEMPGQRSIIMISPDFYNPDYLQEQMEVADQALHSGIVISALDARGLYVVGFDASIPMESPELNAEIVRYMHDEALANADVLSELAYSTGGTFVQNTNDLEGGIRRITTPPEYSYLLGFSPLNLKFDGHFHNLKVTVRGQKLNIQTRKGYYAPKQATNAAEQAKQQIHDEVFSQEELHDLPVELHTQFFKTSDEEAKLSVLVRLDVRHLHYRKVDGRNNNSLTVVSVVFDRNGNFVTGNQKTLQMHWKDETLGTKLASGVTLKSNFEVKPGSYLVRLVVRDDEGQLAAQNGAIEIP